jgi:hypothetical protein
MSLYESSSDFRSAWNTAFKKESPPNRYDFAVKLNGVPGIVHIVACSPEHARSLLRSENSTQQVLYCRQGKNVTQ